MSIKDILFGDHYKELGRRKIFSRKKYFYEFLLVAFLVSSLSIYSVTNAEEKEVDYSWIANYSEMLCTLKLYEASVYQYILQVANKKGLKLNLTCRAKYGV
jgi:cell division protein FtsL